MIGVRVVADHHMHRRDPGHCGDIAHHRTMIEAAIVARGEDHRRSCGREDVLQFVRPVVGQQRVDGGTERQHRRRHDDRLVAIGQLHGHERRCIDTAALQERGEARGIVAQLAIAVAAPVVDDGQIARTRPCMIGDATGKRARIPMAGSEIVAAPLGRRDDIGLARVHVPTIVSRCRHSISAHGAAARPRLALPESRWQTVRQTMIDDVDLKTIEGL